MGNCQTSMYCCGQNDSTDNMGNQNESGQKPFSQANLFELVVKDEKQLKKLENIIRHGVNSSQLSREICKDYKKTLQLLRKPEKTQEEYERLCLKDGELTIKAMEFGSLKYMGQVRLIAIYQTSDATGMNGSTQQYRLQQGDPSYDSKESVVDYEYNKCGYGKLIWPDGSTFEGYWINGQACGVGVFRAPTEEVFEGFWQQDRTTNLCVFRQNNNGQDMFAENTTDGMDTNSDKPQEKQNGKGIEVWSDGSYYHGNFKDGVKEGQGVYFWADGSKYSGSWSNDEMSGFGNFQWSDGRYFEGMFQSGVMHGYGNYVWQDGRKYEGQYRFNKKHGEGTYTYSDGSKYKGEWEEGMQHGIGCIIDADSTYERQGQWAFGKLKKWLTVDPATGQHDEHDLPDGNTQGYGSQHQHQQQRPMRRGVGPR